MRSTLGRYIAAIFLRNLLLSTFSLAFLFYFQTVVTQLNDFPIQQLLIVNIYDFPRFFVQTSPPAALLATVLTLTQLGRSNELVAAFSIGISLKGLIMMIIPSVIVLAAVNLLMQDRILPPLFEAKTLYFWREMNQKNDFFLDVKKNKIWYRSKNVIYNLRSYDPDTHQISGMTVYTFNAAFKLISLTTSRTARYEPPKWVLSDGTQTTFSGVDHIPIAKSFKELELLIPEKPTDFQEIEKEANRLRIEELIQFVKRNKDAGINTRSYEVQLHSRFSLSTSPIVMCLLAFPFSIRSNRSGGMAKALAICLGWTLFYWISFSFGLSFGQAGTFSPWFAAWSPSLIFLGIAGLFLSRPLFK